MGGPLKLKFANHFIIYQNCPLRGHFGTGRLHSQLWDWGVKTNADSLKKMRTRIEKNADFTF